MPVIQEIVELLAKIPPGAIELVRQLVSGAAASEDPQAYVERKLAAAASHEAAQKLVDAALERTGSGG